MPRDDCLGLHDEERLRPAGPATAKGDPQHAIFGLEREAACRPAEDGDLLAKGQVLEHQLVLRSHRIAKRGRQQPKVRTHGGASCPRRRQPSEDARRVNSTPG